MGREVKKGVVTGDTKPEFGLGHGASNHDKLQLSGGRNFFCI